MANDTEHLSDIWRRCDHSKPWMVDVDDTVAYNKERQAEIAKFKFMSEFDALSIKEKMEIMSRRSCNEDKLTNFGIVFRAFMFFHSGVNPVYVSARPTWLYRTTKFWLHEYDMMPCGVVVRRYHQLSWSSEAFKYHVAKIIRPSVIIDDRPQMADVAKKLDVEFVHVHNGWM